MEDFGDEEGNGKPSSLNPSAEALLRKLHQSKLRLGISYSPSLADDNVMGHSVVMVGYIMKPSQEEHSAKRGAFPIHPTSNGLVFLPVTFDLPLLPSQLQHVDMVLLKATDEIVSVQLSGSSVSGNKVAFTRGMQKLRA